MNVNDDSKLHAMGSFIVTVKRTASVELFIAAADALEADWIAAMAVKNDELIFPYCTTIKVEETKEIREPDYVSLVDAKEKEGYPGWTAECGECAYGYLMPPDMASLTDSDVREWGRRALDVRAGCEADGPSGQVDYECAFVSMTWSSRVLRKVWERLGPDDELQAYADAVYAAADAQRAETAAALFCQDFLRDEESYTSEDYIEGDRWHGWAEFLAASTPRRRHLLVRLMATHFGDDGIARRTSDDKIRAMAEAVEKWQKGEYPFPRTDEHDVED